MDHHHLPKRSASHGTLRSSYAYHGRPNNASSPLRLLHKPLRSVNENSALLPSPGALESMLKTTTETGDIGIFSIRPLASPQRKGAFINISQNQPRPRRSVDEVYGHYHRNRFPGNRDTTSEILSMYTSDSQKSLAGNLSPISTDDFALRSLSMTTCGSRHLPHQNSTTTLQSQASGSSLLQRPRSPFPYPTRLKRPGVRPASPALTDAGRVDYSRMVEIDRISLVRCLLSLHPLLANGTLTLVRSGPFTERTSPSTHLDQEDLLLLASGWISMTPITIHMAMGHPRFVNLHGIHHLFAVSLQHLLLLEMLLSVVGLTAHLQEHQVLLQL